MDREKCSQKALNSLRLLFKSCDDVIQHGEQRSVLVHQVRLQVLGQVVTAREAFGAGPAREALLTGVRAQVPLELVRARAHPAADERTLTCVPPQVRLQVRRLAVHLPAARHVAHVLLSLPRRVAALLAVGAHAPPASARLGVQQGGDLSLVLAELRVTQNPPAGDLKLMC